MRCWGDAESEAFRLTNAATLGTEQFDSEEFERQEGFSTDAQSLVLRFVLGLGKINSHYEFRYLEIKYFQIES